MLLLPEAMLLLLGSICSALRIEQAQSSSTSWMTITQLGLFGGKSET